MLRPSLLALVLAVAFALPAQAASGGLEIFPDPYRLVLLIVLFTLLIWPANAVLWRPVLDALEERGNQIQGSRDRAEKIAAEADTVLAQYEEAVTRARTAAESERRGLLDQARSAQGDITATARTAAEEHISGARDEIGAALDEARGQLRGEAESLARAAASSVLGRELSS
ncbi:MAG: ATP synthase F0 subunit B [Myxococcota bacterium]